MVIQRQHRAQLLERVDLLGCTLERRLSSLVRGGLLRETASEGVVAPGAQVLGQVEQVVHVEQEGPDAVPNVTGTLSQVVAHRPRFEEDAGQCAGGTRRGLELQGGGVLLQGRLLAHQLPDAVYGVAEALQRCAGQLSPS